MPHVGHTDSDHSLTFTFFMAGYYTLLIETVDLLVVILWPPRSLYLSGQIYLGAC